MIVQVMTWVREACLQNDKSNLLLHITLKDVGFSSCMAPNMSGML
jgi:hypothetical protein